jgi:hypothetical protein
MWARYIRHTRITCLPANLIGRLAHQIPVDTVRYPSNMTNCGLIRTLGGFIGVFKNTTWSNWDEMRQPVPGFLTFRHEPEQFRAGLYRVDFNASLEVQSVKPLNIEGDDRTNLNEEPQVFEDARLFSFSGQVWILAVKNGHQPQAWPCLGKLEGTTVRLKEIRNSGSDPPQKNWCPFVYQDSVFLEQWPWPHVVFEVDPGSATCKKIVESSPAGVPTGRIRGSTPPVQIGNVFLGCSHSRITYKKHVEYVCQFYLFQASPPFQVTHLTPDLKIYDRNQRLQFPIGLCFDEKTDRIILSCGILESDNFFFEIERRKISSLLRPVAAGIAKNGV